MNYYLKVLKNYTNYHGRATRREYWTFNLISFLISIALSVMGRMISVPILQFVYSIAVMIPHIMLYIRRAHDSDQRGWWILVPLFNLYLTFVPSTPGENRFGPEETPL